ncbi:phosphatase PAP2 family protein [Mycobacterium sp. NAZ190054]|uniref:phosphatase PAP2 family protein n=1 Tax=Mycobacterium sp. NAZ190054 TaxID=1747766 RepID=UPI000AEA47A1|nr:phosphatase PAP2 family protein [Mycobacterium sp. NAZ190054]
MVALVLLGLAVGKGSTPVDQWFQQLGGRHPELGYLLVFTDGRVVVALCAVVFVAALVQRKWRLAAVTAVTPPLAVLAARLGKRLFGRLKDGELCFPSGHTTTTFVVLATAVLLLGATTWVLVVAAVAMTLGVVGQAVSYHFFTDAIGALLLGSALVCVATTVAGLDRRQPECELDHSGR